MSEPTDDSGRRWLNVEQAASYAGVSRHTIYRAVDALQIQHTRVSGRRVLKFLPEWIDAWLVKGATPAVNAKGDETNGSLQTL